MLRPFLILLLIFSLSFSIAQIPVARDTIMVIENGYVLKMPWANGINFANISSMDLNGDNKKDLVVFDRLNIYGTGRFRCFINVGNPGQIIYKEDTYLPYRFPYASNWAVLRDYNCDGKEDLFCSTSGGIKVYKNTSSAGNLSFTLFNSLINSDYNPAGPPSVSNLYASSVGVPGIVDVDGDGDLDILTFSPQGIYIEYHKNVSIEKNYGCDSLIFQLTNGCWGRINESNCQVNMNVCDSKPGNSGETINQLKAYHAGSCLTCFDSDGDNDLDMIMGDVLCNEVQYIHNSGSPSAALFTDTTKLYPNYPNKGNTTQARLNSFPCSYYVDVNDDSKKDLLVTPNLFGSENYKSVWLYKNTSTTNTVNFQFVKNNFLQDEMIEVGQNSFPVLFDYDGDTRKDLLIGNYGYYANSALNARLTLYKNTGNFAQPSFSLITRDYGNLSTFTLSNGIPPNDAMPAVGDIDADGDIDILIGTSSGQVHWLENTGTSSAASFSLIENPFSFTTTSAAAAPQLFDLDNDGLLDLLIGMQNGRISWYKNIGSTTVPSFSFITDFLGGVDVRVDINLYGYDGYAVPYFYVEGGVTKLLVGSFRGTIFQYTVPSPFSVSNSFSLITESVNGYNEGGQSAVWFEDINDDGKGDLFIGNSGGGLTFCSSKSQYVGIQEYSPDKIDKQVFLFPNPSNGLLQMKLDVVDFQKANVIIYDLLGKEAFRSALLSNNKTLDVSGLNKGIYFVNIIITADFQNYSVTKKIIKE
jgi:hypothetical protein